MQWGMPSEGHLTISSRYGANQVQGSYTLHGLDSRDTETLCGCLTALVELIVGVSTVVDGKQTILEKDTNAHSLRVSFPGKVQYSAVHTLFIITKYTLPRKEVVQHP
jgi:hypothetical protein